MFPSIYYQNYTINFPKYWLVRDKPTHEYSTDEKPAHRSMIFHVSAGDYITTLASIMRFFEESIYEKNITKEMRALQLESIRGVISDLLYLNKHYEIVPKDEKSNPEV